MNLPTRLAEIARVSPGQEAIVFKNQRLTYTQLDTRVSQLASGLKQLGIKTGDRVLLAMRNCPEYVIAYYAIMRMKGIVVPVNPHYTINEMGVIIKDCQPAAVITCPEKQELFEKISRTIKIPAGIIVNSCDPEKEDIFTYEQINKKGTAAFQEVKYSHEDVAEIMYTAGQAGKPKGAMLTSYNLYSNALTFAQVCSLSPADRALLTAPVYHAAAQTCVMNGTIVSGGTLVIQEGWRGAEEVLKEIAEEKITFFFGTPTMYSLLLKYPELDKCNVKSLRIALCGGASLPPGLYESMISKLGISLVEGYGLTETSPVVTINFIGESGKRGSVGKPIPGVEVKIFDYEDREVPKGQVGEIVVRGPNVMKGYLNLEEETRWLMRNDWFHTGDLAYEDNDGYIYIVDRKKDLIIRGGLNINPREIEEVLYDHPGIFEVAVVGVPDAVMGEEILAYIMPREGHEMTEAELKTFCKDKMAKYKIPRYFRFVDNLPKTSSGKLMRKELQSWMAKQKPPV
ncbi:class I adenylate-forming enzyme family protein [Desulfallas thermosapovorans]|uniref:Long-chain acyl-CoA synthetase n=1 Tax=Desulfallas thermosapovorans DSM 6562 TaxID=1121431 RepID=A0A5S4ZT38_9FIRM|nr:long-chain-fatty-acid--CoA ligase [Desulfallas thermosapovorans]TYO95951.1 long-chain acyl-CoA synthetase [Desulfallas thermosapovorans DSM 6562]